MKNFIFLITFLAFYITNAQITLPVSEDFSNGFPNDWENIDSISSGSLWQIDTSTTITTTTGDNGYAHFRGTWNVGEQHYNANSSHLITPTIDMSTNTNVILKFETELYLEGATVQINVSVDNGLTYTNVYEISSDNWPATIHNVNLSTIAAGYSQVKIAFSVISDATNYNPDLRLDDILIYEEVANDIAITEWITPLSDCSLGSDEHIKIKLKNWGSNITTEDIMLSFSLDNGVSFSTPEQFSNTLNPGEEEIFEFNNIADFSSVQTYNCIVKVEMLGDEQLSNNELAYTIIKTETISTFPYYQDFENGNDGWLTLESESSWELGTPNSTTLQNASSGINCWATNLTGDYLPQELSYVYSPCFDFSNLSQPIISVDVWYNMQLGYLAQDISASLQYSTNGNCDTCWHTIGTVGSGENWYNTIYGWANISNGWETAVHSLDTLAGQPEVRFRIEINNPNGSTREGFAFDNFEIYEQPAIDVLVNELTIHNQPNASCSFGTNEMVKIQIYNNGTDEITQDIPVKYSIDGGVTWNEEIFTNTNGILPGNEALFIFTTTYADLNNNGIYNAMAVTNLATDERHQNDTIRATLVSKPVISSFPYLEDFETVSANYWVTGTDGASNDWELGVPAGTIINSAYSGTNAWVTTLNGNYNSNQESYIESPCFDLTNTTFPALRFKMFANLISGDYLNVKYSTDGIFWNNLIESTYGEDQSWTDIEKGLDFLNNETSVSFRFYFISNETYEAEGIAIDDIEIISDEDINTSINNTELKNEFIIFPNPAKDNLCLIVKNEQLYDFAYILDITGKPVLTLPLQGTKLSINISDLQNGVYFIKVGNKIKKFIKS